MKVTAKIMVLDQLQIKDILKNNPNKGLISTGQKYNAQMRKHFFRERLESNMATIDGFEKDTLKALRVKYAKSNKDLFSRLARPVDKVFSARGGSKYLDLPEENAKKATNLSLNISGGYSIRKWLETNWKYQYMIDPNGVVMMEILPEREARMAKSIGRSITYPTYKSIQKIYDYQPNGSKIEYIVFKVENEEKIKNKREANENIFRVVDDAMDYWVKLDGEVITILDEHSYPNLFMYVPAILNSDIVNQQDQLTKVSIFDEVLELADQFLTKGSIKLTYEFFHAYPKYWEYADSCKVCKGETVVNGELCKSCNGTGKQFITSVSDNKILSWPRDKDTPIVAPNVAGYVEPSKNYYEIATHDLKLLEDLMTFTMWGANTGSQTQGMSTDGTGETKTATQVMNDIKPQSDRLFPISDCAQAREKFILDATIRVNINQNYPGSSVHYGKRYMIEGPDEIWNRYLDSKTKGASWVVLNELLMEFYEAKYNSDPVRLEIQMKMMAVEPFVHLTISEVKALSPDENDYKAKLYFGQWLGTISEAEKIGTNREGLTDKLMAFASAKQLPAPPAPKKIGN